MNARIIFAAAVASAIGVVCLVEQADAADNLWQGDVSADWNTAGNWSVLPGGQAFVPQGSSNFNQRAIIGTDRPIGSTPPGGALAGVAELTTLLASAKQTIHGLYLGSRQRDYTFAGAPFVNAEPAPGALTGSLTISGATTVLRNSGTPTLPNSSSGADGRIVVGEQGRGYLTMLGGTLTGLGLDVAGENDTSGLGTSLLDLRGSSTLTIDTTGTGTAMGPGTTTLSRRVRIEGPDVNFSTQGVLTLSSSNTYTAAITSATAHSAMTTQNNAVVDGNLVVEFSGAAAMRDPIASLGQTWDLVDSTLNENAIDGNFGNLAPNGEIEVSGLDAAHSPPLGAVYRVQKTSTPGHSLLQLVYDRVLILTVDRDAKTLTIRNPYGGNIAIDSYSVTSERGSLLPTYAGLGTTTPNAGTWVKPQSPGMNTVNALTEVKEPDMIPPIEPDDAYDLTPVPSISLGMGFERTAVANDIANFGHDGEDLVFQYSGPGGELVNGHIEYVGNKFYNNLTLVVDPDNGNAFLKNDSDVTLKFDGYSIISSTGVLSGTGFTGLGGTWQTTNPTAAGAITQSNLDGFTTLGAGAQLSLGNITNGAALSDEAQDGITLEYILSESLTATSSLGDFNNDGRVDAGDYVRWRNNLNDPTEADINNNGDGGGVGISDYAVWKDNYGNTGGPVPDEEFMFGAVDFDLLDGSGGGGISTPEPASGLLLALGLSGILIVRGRSRRIDRRPSENTTVGFTDSGQVGAYIMTRQIRFGLLAAVGVVGMLFVASPSRAQTHGFTLNNFSFELPGPQGTKTVAFDDTGVPNGAIPGWTFTGGAGGLGEINEMGVEPRGDQLPGDSGVEGGGQPDHRDNPTNEALLSTLDGKMYQTATGFNIHTITADQQYKISFHAHDIFTIGATDQEAFTGQNLAQITARVYYGASRTSLLPMPLTAQPSAEGQVYEIIIPSTDPAVMAGSPALGQPIGIEFDCTSLEFNVGMPEPNVEHSWIGIDNVVIEVAPVMEGDLNGDGDITVADYVILRDNLQEPLPFESAGDLNGDYFIDLDDFRRFKTLYAAAGAGGLAGGGGTTNAGGGAGVPEPAALFASLAGIMLCGAVRLRRRCLGSVAQRLLVVAFVMAIGLTIVAPAAADLLYYDPFLIGGNPAAGEYSLGYVDPPGDPPGDPNNGQNPTVGPDSPPFLSGPWQIRTSDGNAANQHIVSDTLTYRGIESPGGSVQNVPLTPGTDDDGRVGRYLADPWGTDEVGTYYISFLANFGTVPEAEYDSLAVPNDNFGFRSLEMWPTTGNGVGDDTGRLDIGYNTYHGGLPDDERRPGSAHLRFQVPGGGDSYLTNKTFEQDRNPETNTGLTHLIVLRFILVDTSDPNGDSVSVLLDPATTDEPVVWTATATGLDFTLQAISTLTRFGNVADPGQQMPIFDDLRIATTFVDALPDLPKPGDTNNDGVVDLLDYQAIITHMNLNGTTLEEGDVTGDGQVTIADYRLWKDRREDITGAGGGGITHVAGPTVPEPSSVMLAALVATLLAGCPSRGKR